MINFYDKHSINTTIKALVTLARCAGTFVRITARLATWRPNVNVVYGEAGVHATLLPPTNVRPPASNITRTDATLFVITTRSLPAIFDRTHK